ncbi:hypothetical protein G9A89_020704 [Geosiphon pyriformis]|nr:hypothetical protein G9A89_020704 [Geosiphon pyriformis]
MIGAECCRNLTPASRKSPAVLSSIPVWSPRKKQKIKNMIRYNLQIINDFPDTDLNQFHGASYVCDRIDENKKNLGKARDLIKKTPNNLLKLTQTRASLGN